MSKTPIYVILGLVILFVFAGCSKAPMDNVTQAKSTLENAKAVEADIYFPNDYAQIGDSINVAVAEIDQQKKHFIFSRNYDHPRMLLENATRNAEALIEKTDLRKEEVSMEARQLVIDITTKIEEAQARLELIQSTRQNRESLEKIQAEIELLQKELAVVSTLIENKEYLTALDKATVHYGQSVQLNQEIQTAMNMTTPKKARKS